MITWKLWSALYRPPVQHPLFQRIATRQLTFRHWYWVLVGIALVLSYFGYQLSFQQSRVTIILLALTLQDVVVLVVAFNLLYGCMLVVAVSRTIATSRERGIFDILCLIPEGASVATWTMCTGAVYRGRGFRWFRLAVMLVTIIPLIALMIHLVVPLLLWGSEMGGAGASPHTAVYRQMLLDLTDALALIGAFYAGCVQSVALSVLIGMLIPASMRESGTYLWAAGIFLLVQISSFLMTLIFSLFVLPTLYDMLHLSGWWVELSTPLGRFAFFVGLREIINILVWRMLQYQWYHDVHLA